MTPDVRRTGIGPVRDRQLVPQGEAGDVIQVSAHGSAEYVIDLVFHHGRINTFSDRFGFGSDTGGGHTESTRGGRVGIVMLCLVC